LARVLQTARPGLQRICTRGLIVLRPGRQTRDSRRWQHRSIS